jgi:hypothetical protein
MSEDEYNSIDEAFNASKNKQNTNELFDWLSENEDDMSVENAKKSVKFIWEIFNLISEKPYEEDHSGHDYFTGCLDCMDTWNKENANKKIDLLIKNNFQAVFVFIKKNNLYKIALELSENLRNSNLINEYKTLTNYIIEESSDEWKYDSWSGGRVTGIEHCLDKLDISKAQADKILAMAETNISRKADLKKIKELHLERSNALDGNYDYLQINDNWTKFSRIFD